MFPWGKKCPKWKRKPLAEPFLTTGKDLISRTGSAGWGMREKSGGRGGEPSAPAGHGMACEPQAQGTSALPKIWF